jgi:CRISPR-associated protein Cas8a1/Csx13
MEPLNCNLFAPGMTPLHRAGLGGLVSTLRWIERTVPEKLRPRGRWGINERTVTIEWEEGREEIFLGRLFSLAFQLAKGLISLPGQYGPVPPPPEVCAALHNGLVLSFYDHGVQSRGAAGAARSATYEVDDKPVTYTYLPLKWYKHRRDGCRDFLKALRGGLPITRSLFPGAIERHAGLGATHVMQPPRLALPLLFAPVGVLALKAGGKKVNVRGKRRFKPGAAVLVPDLHDLTSAHLLLPALLPRNGRECQIASVTDAALQAEIRLRASRLLNPELIRSVRCVWHCPSDWNSQLQPPSAVAEVRVTNDDPRLDQFEMSMKALIPPAPRKNEKTGEYFWPRSYVRPLVADNLVAGRPWYAGFSRLMTAQDSVTGNPIRDYLHFERRGLHAMTQEMQWGSPGEEIVVRAVHEALRCRYGQIASENAGNPAAMKNRWNGEYKRQRLALAGAKTPDAARHALADLWSRAGSNKVLKDAWPQVLPMFAGDKWQLTRDLALLALASYQGKGEDEIVVDTTEGVEKEEES